MARFLGKAANQGLPPLREDLRLYEVAAQRDGSPTWTLQDPVTNTFMAIGWLEYELLSRWHLGDKEKVLESTNAETPLNVDASELESLVDVLQKTKFLDAHGFEQTDALIEEEGRSKNSLVNYLLHQYLFFRVPIWNPDAWLKRVYPSISFIYSKQSLWLLGCAALIAFYLTIQKVDLFAASFVDTFTFEGILGYLAALIVTKSLHELGHAFTATRYGVRVAHMGVAFVVMWPMLYTDTGETWRVKRSKHRLAIASAGVSAELSLAILALLAWNLAPEGPVRDALFFLATTAWVISILINVSPFLRFDGYYILSDILDIPNLHERSASAKITWIRRHLLGWEMDYSEEMTARRKSFYIVFSILSWVYRMVVFLGIAAAVYYFFFKALGIVLALVEIWWFVLKPMVAEMAVWRENWSQTKASKKRGLFVFTLLMGLFIFVPWQTDIKLQGWMHASKASVLYAPDAALLRVLPPNGSEVSAGELLFELTQPETEANIKVAVAAKESIEDQLQGLLGIRDGEALRLELVESWREKDASHQAEKAKLDALKLYAPFDGFLTDLDPSLAPNVWVNPEQPLAVLVDRASWVVDAFVPQDQYARITQGAKVKFFTLHKPLVPLTGSVVSLDTRRLEELPEPMLSAQFGGAISVENDQTGLTPRETLFKVRIQLDEAPVSKQVAIGVANIEAQPKSIFDTLFNALALVLVREVSF